jgi:polyglutamine-binding protein 1
VIAESYDDDSKTTSTTRRQAPNAAGAPGCPNKWNPYHCCVEFCYDHWREGMPENRLSVEYNRRRVRMLKKYPLPNGWKEVRRFLQMMVLPVGLFVCLFFVSFTSKHKYHKRHQ